ncbi:unnamed protein product [Tilletia caries]|nr:unnamed protein product [Tilletia caries]
MSPLRRTLSPSTSSSGAASNEDCDVVMGSDNSDADSSNTRAVSSHDTAAAPAAKRARLQHSSSVSGAVARLQQLLDRQDHDQVIKQASALLQSGLPPTEQAIALALRSISYSDLGIHHHAAQDALASQALAERNPHACLPVAKALTTAGMSGRAYAFIVKARTLLALKLNIGHSFLIHNQLQPQPQLQHHHQYGCHHHPTSPSHGTLTPPYSSNSPRFAHSFEPASAGEDDLPLLRDVYEVEARLRPSGFAAMPIELIQACLALIGDVRQTAQCMRVSRQWKIAIQSCPRLWKAVELWKPHRLPARGYVIDEPECQLPPPRTALVNAIYALRSSIRYTNGNVKSVSLDLRGSYRDTYAESCWAMLQTIAPNLDSLALCIGWQDIHAKANFAHVLRTCAKLTNLVIYYDAKPRKDPDDEFEPLRFSLLTDDPNPVPLRKVHLSIPECEVDFDNDVAQRFAHVQDFALVRDVSEDVSITWVLAFLRAARLSLIKYQLSCPVSDAIWCPPGASSAVKRGDPFIAPIILENLTELRADFSEWGTCAQAINTRFVMSNVREAEIVTTVPHCLVGFCLFRVRTWSITEIYDEKVAEMALNYLLHLAPELEVLEMRTPAGGHGRSVLPNLLLDNLISLSNSVPANASGYSAPLSRLRSLKFVNSPVTGRQLIGLVQARLKFSTGPPNSTSTSPHYLNSRQALSSGGTGIDEDDAMLVDAQQRIQAEPMLPPFRPILSIMLTDCVNVSEEEQRELARLVPVFHCSPPPPVRW